MQIRLSSGDGGSVHDLRGLADWLRRVEDLRGRVALSARAIDLVQMGSIPDVIGIAVGGGGTATVLVRSIFTWLGQRPRGTRVSLEAENGDGRKVHLELSSDRDSDAVVGEVLAFLSEGSSRDDESI